MLNRITRVAMTSAILLLAPVSGGSAAPVTVLVPGYTYTPFVTTTLTSASDLELDASGNIYLGKPGDIRQ